MKLKSREFGVLAALSMTPWLAWAEAVVHHQLLVKLNPETDQLQVHDVVTLSPLKAPLRFSLNAGFTITSPDPAARLTADLETPPAPSVKIYDVVPPQGRSELTLDYQGKLDLDPAAGTGSDQQNSQAYLSGNGAYLDGDSHWYPQFDDELVTFSLEAALPPSWRAISQGAFHPAADARQDNVQWVETQPQEEIYLLAGPYRQYSRSLDTVTASVLLRNPDDALADRYLPAIAEYVTMYSRLLGPYPYDKFAVVENTWESGYGMPSFTLLGPKVMRFPFILRSSLPHEILHNWWGNGVYVDFHQGNWSEGLTAYLADHLLREQAGEGAAYRRNALLRYTNYVSAGNDFALEDFQGRHNEASQAVGYDKALMVFHMLRVQLGDARFVTALRNFYREQRFRRADWDDLRRAFEAVAGSSLQSEFDQWLNRRGAPALQLAAARAQRSGDHFELTAEIRQTQPGPVYRLHIPLAVQLEGQEQAWQTIIDLSQKRQTIRLAVPARPWRLAVDPEFDVFRRLDPGESPPTLSEALGAEAMLIVLPSAASPALREGYERLAQTWANSGGNIEIRWDKDLEKLPADRPVWLLGWENRSLSEANADMGGQLTLSQTEAQLGGQKLRREERSVVLAVRRDASGPVLVWLGCDNPAAIPGLARKLPHYGSYSYLAFQGDEPTNIFKGQWQVLDSPLNIAVQQGDHAASSDKPFHLRPRTALIGE